MSEKEQQDQEALAEDELERQAAEELPDREVMTILPIDPTAGSKFLPEPPALDTQ
jgi:hypothetical protein